MPRKIKVVAFLVLLISLSVITYYLSHKEVFAQVLSGNIQILDISIDLGGGALKSGNIQLKNTSIGQVASGNFITSGNNIVCSGHACKNDYNYTPGQGGQPTLQQLVVTQSQDSVARGNYKTSGLRDPDGGRYYNSLSIRPVITGDEENIELSGVAFTEDSTEIVPIASRGSFEDSFPYILKSADSSKGFVVVYANKNIDYSYGPEKKGLNNCGFNFCENNYYVYLDGKWSDRFGKDDPVWTTSFTGDRIIRAADPPIFGTSDHNPPLKPAFRATLGKNLGSRIWGTYGFVRTTTSLPASVTAAEPVASEQQLQSNQLNPTSVTINSTFYMFSIL